uniref:Uncharacterized protein ycf33 n=1 Tax=Porphyridium purpureum TaxID=35688 RepID=W0RYP9_PORPP|nr:conserved hypothetical plastid protein [Porphyridium purpureum]ATJ02918.1 hypothetical protein [Porphyridium purpureum]BAO23696.1 conserved hypothetical plastid protein [Porphyridium purpureum]
MKDFIENVVRLMRFFLSSMLGLLVTVFGPFISLINSKNKFKNLLITFLSIFITLSMLFTLSKMLDL